MLKWLWRLSPALFSFVLPAIASAQISVEQTGLYATGEPAYGTGQRNIDIGTYVARFVIQPLFALSGVIFLAFMVYAGILWMTDQGDADQVSKAKRILVHSTIGLIIMLSAYVITDFVLAALTGTAVAPAPDTPGGG